MYASPRPPSAQIDWWRLGTAVLLLPVVAVNFYFVARAWTHLSVIPLESAVDWRVLVDASHLANPYAEASFRWSPVAAWLIGLMAPMGVLGWRLLQVASLLALRDWRLIGLVLISAPFWADVVGGSMMTFVAVAAFTAHRGSRVGAVCFLGLALLIPRPLMLPLLVWLMWKRPEYRLIFAAGFVLHAALVLGSGLADEWIDRLIASQSEMQHAQNIGPSRLIGLLWIPLGLAIGTALTLVGRVGWASLAVSPYVFPYYFLMLLLEWPRPATRVDQDSRIRVDAIG